MVAKRKKKWVETKTAEKDISNKALAGLLIAAIVISISGTMMVINKNGGLTGFATQQNASASVNISGVVSIKLNTNSINFGTGSVTPGQTYCNISQIASTAAFDETPASCGTWSNVTGSISLENDGNVNANITVKSTKNATDFVGGTSPGLFSQAANDEASSCNLGLQSNFTTLDTIARSFCQRLQYGDALDSLKFGIKIKIPSDAIGLKSNTITFDAAQSS